MFNIFLNVLIVIFGALFLKSAFHINLLKVPKARQYKYINNSIISYFII